MNDLNTLVSSAFKRAFESAEMFSKKGFHKFMNIGLFTLGLFRNVFYVLSENEYETIAACENEILKPVSFIKIFVFLIYTDISTNTNRESNNLVFQKKEPAEQ